MKDNFSNQAAVYAQFRPHYPEELIDYICSFVLEKGLAWDCATGNGQCAKLLGNHFHKVFATDISQQQMDNAFKASNIFYALEAAENTTLQEKTVDLITVAQAIHWFDFEKFYAEVKRVGKTGGVIAVWCYSLLKISEEIDEIINDYHFNTLDTYWDPERKYLDDDYANVPFPFEKMETKPFTIELDWTMEQLEGYFETWSALQKFMKANSFSPVPALMDKIKLYWGDSETRKIIFPIHLKLGIIA